VSLRIDVDTVSAVLIAGSWYVVKDNSFDLDAYEYVEGGSLIFNGERASTLSSTGFTFVDSQDVEICGPVTSIQAVRRTRL
jgi:hypothetical protein